MNKISDKNAILIIFITIIFVFGLIFSVKSPERKVIDSPIMWKDDYTTSSINKIYVKDDLYLVEFNILPPTHIDLSLHKDWLDNYGNELMKNQYFKYSNVDFEEIANSSRR